MLCVLCVGVSVCLLFLSIFYRPGSDFYISLLSVFVSPFLSVFVSPNDTGGTGGDSSVFGHVAKGGGGGAATELEYVDSTINAYV